MGESSEFQTTFRQQRPGGKRRISTLRLVSYRSDRTAPTWQAGATSQDALIDLAGYAATPQGGQALATGQYGLSSRRARMSRNGSGVGHTPVRRRRAGDLAE